MKYETKILTTPYQRPDAYGALNMPVYYTSAFEFPSAKAMSDAFCGRSPMPSYSRIANPTTTYLEERVRQLTGAVSVTALNTGMAAIAYALTAVSAAGLNIVASKHLFGNSVSLLRDTLGGLGVETRFADFTHLEEVERLMEEDPPVKALTPRQMEILEGLTRGLTNQDIAKELGIREDRVKDHVNAIFSRLNAANRTEAVAIAMRKYLLKK